MRVISRPEKAPRDEDEEVLAEDEAEDEVDELNSGEEEEDETEEDSDDEMADAAAQGAGVDEEAERPQGMDIDNGSPSTSDRVSRRPSLVPGRELFTRFS